MRSWAEREPYFDEGVIRFLELNPFAYVAYRALYVKEVGTEYLSEESFVPFVSSPFFTVILFLYLLWKRIESGIRHRSLPAELLRNDHIVSISSDDKYRKHTLIQVATALADKGQDVLILRTGSISLFDKNNGNSLRQVQHGTLHAFVRLHRYPLFIGRSIQMIVQISRLLPTPSVQSFIVAYNLLLLEFVKAESVREITQNQPTIHTFAPMPYLTQHTDPDSVFVYQHGTQITKDPYLVGVPFFESFTYLVWGKPWLNQFRNVLSDDADVIPVGSPWFEHLSKSGGQLTGGCRIDVLFISQSHGFSGSNEQYEEIFNTIKTTCEQKGLSLAVKLHPEESGDWYRERGWEGFIREFESIESAIRVTSIAITDTSTAFIECSVLGVPVIVTDIQNTGLSDLSPVQNVSFVSSLEEISTKIDAWNNTEVNNGSSEQLIIKDNTVERIIREVTRN